MKLEWKGDESVLLGLVDGERRVGYVWATLDSEEGADWSWSADVACDSGEADTLDEAKAAVINALLQHAEYMGQLAASARTLRGDGT